MRYNRRDVIKTAGIASTVAFTGLAGCSGGSGDGGDGDGGDGGSTDGASREIPSFSLGHGLAAEEPLWLMDANPDLLDNWGNEYEAEFVQFDASTSRFQAFQAGEIDAGTVTMVTSFFAVDRGLPLTIVASITQETEEQYATSVVANSSNDIALSQEGLEGKSIGICGFQDSCHMWAGAAAQQVGLDPESDIDLVQVPFPTMGSAVAEDRVDAATMHQPFDVSAINQYDMEEKFDAVDTTGFEHDLLEVWFSTQYLNRNEEAIRMFLEDYTTAVEHYQNNTEEARQTILDAGFVQTPEDVYLNLPVMATSARPLTDGLDKLNQTAVDLGWIDETVDTDLLYDLSYLPGSS